MATEEFRFGSTVIMYRATIQDHTRWHLDKPVDGTWIYPSDVYYELDSRREPESLSYNIDLTLGWVLKPNVMYMFPTREFPGKIDANPDLVRLGLSLTAIPRVFLVESKVRLRIWPDQVIGRTYSGTLTESTILF